MLVPSTGQIKKPEEDAEDSSVVQPDRTALLRLTDYLPLRKGTIHKALSLIHHGALDCASHRLPLPPLPAAFDLWDILGFVRAHLILVRKTAGSRRPHWLSELPRSAEELEISSKKCLLDISIVVVLLQTWLTIH